MDYNDTGLLLNKNNITLQRQYFKEMTRLIGIKVLYRAPMQNKRWTTYGEIDSNYYLPIPVGCIFDEHPTIWTTKKLGWATQLQEDNSIIHVPYDLKDLQVGSIFIIPSGIDDGQGRLFMVRRMSTIMVYPASIACMISPIYKDNQASSTIHDFKHSDFNLLSNDDEDYI